MERNKTIMENMNHKVTFHMTQEQIEKLTFFLHESDKTMNEVGDDMTLTKNEFAYPIAKAYMVFHEQMHSLGFCEDGLKCPGYLNHLKRFNKVWANEIANESKPGNKTP